MSLRLKPFPATKDSGLPWLGKVPDSWRILRGKNVFRVINIRSQTGAEELLTVSAVYGVVPRRQATVTMFKAESYVGHKLCWPGDLVINSLWAWMQGLGIARHHGLISSAYSVYRPQPAFAEYANYFHYALRSDAYKWELQTRSKGVWLSRLQLSDPAFLDMPIILPPPCEVTAIVRYLDQADKRIRRFIAAKRRLIELLNEQKQAIIQKAVTRGLDPNVRLKPSGIDWLGDVPADWVTKPAKYFLREIDERSSTGAEELLSVSHITGVSPRRQKNITMFMAESYVGHKVCRSGDLVINTMWAWMGALGVSKQTGIVSPSYAVYRPRDSCAFAPGFLDRLLRTTPYISEFTCRSTGIRSSRLRLYPEEFLKIPLIQPSKEDQDRIVDTIEGQTHELDTAISRTNREIELIHEYRTRLIAEVVTGKLDVRGVELPPLEEAEELPAVGDEALDEPGEEETELEPVEEVADAAE